MVVTLVITPISDYLDAAPSTTSLVALLVCLIPTTIGGLLSAIGIAGINRLTQYNVLAMSGRAVEAAGDINTLLLDKTGTITFGNRFANEFLPFEPYTEEEVGRAAMLASLGDGTPEGRSILTLGAKLGLEVERRRRGRGGPLHRRDAHERHGPGPARATAREPATPWPDTSCPWATSCRRATKRRWT